MTARLALPPLRNVGAVRLSREPLDGHPAYVRLLSDAPRTGACPVWLTSPEDLRLPDDPQAAAAAVARCDPVGFLAGRWSRNCPLCGCRDPFGDVFPGLASVARSTEEPVVVAARVVADFAEPWRAHLAIVPVRRSADVVAALGWTGACDHADDLAGMSAVLRTWEDRFGAVVVRLDRHTLWVAVASPPRTAAECRAVAAEHLAFDHDLESDEQAPLRDYADRLRGTPLWRFSWD